MIVCFTVFGLARLGLQSCIGELYPALHADSRQVALATDVWRARCAWEALADAVTTPAFDGKLRVVHDDPVRQCRKHWDQRSIRYNPYQF